MPVPFCEHDLFLHKSNEKFLWQADLSSWLFNSRMHYYFKKKELEGRRHDLSLEMTQIQLWKFLSSVYWYVTDWKLLVYTFFQWQKWPFFVVYIIYFLKCHEKIPEKGILCINSFWVCFRIFRKKYTSPWMWNIWENALINF